MTELWPPFYLDFGKNDHVQMITQERIDRSQIIFCTYVYNHTRKVKLESGHTPPKSDRIMAPFYLEIGKINYVLMINYERIDGSK